MWLLLFAVFPQHLDLTGAPGAEVEIPLLISTDEQLQLVGSGVLELDTAITTTGTQMHTVSARIAPYATAGEHTNLVYVAPQSDAALVPATAVAVRTVVEERNTNHVLRAETAKTFAPKYTGVFLALAIMLGILLAIFVATRMRRA